MELIISEEKTVRITNSYKVDIEFMLVDCNGAEHQILIVPEKDLLNENIKEAFERYLTCLESLHKLDSEGRGDIGDDKKFKKFYGSAQYFEDVVENTNRHISNLYTIYFPTDGDNDYYYSVYKYDITYLDDNGDEHKVSVKY